MRYWSIFWVTGTLVLATGVPAARQPTRQTTSVSEGTSMAVAVSPDRTRLVIDLQGALWVLPREGGRATRITDDLHDARQPAWSPDGTRIAFQSYRHGTWDIWTVAPDGADAHAVTSGPFDDREPHWSPDGTRLAFSSDRSGNYDIWVLDVGTGDVRQVTHDPANDYWPAWSPDGREIAFVAARREGGGIRAVTLDGVERVLVQSADTLGAPAWTPDGQGVVFNALRAGATRLVRGDHDIVAGEDVTPFRPQWTTATSFVYTADGKIKERVGVDGRADVRVIPFDADLQLTRASYTPRRRDFDSSAPRRVLGIVRPGLSPDGTRLVFSALGDLWTATNGGTPTRLTDDEAVDTEPAWSPDGKRVAYVSDREGSFDVYVRDLATDTDERITDSALAEMWPSWSPDGSRLTFIRVGSLVGGQVFVVDLKTRETRLVLDGRIGPLHHGWSPDGRAIYVSVLEPYSSRFREGVNQVLAIPLDEEAPRPITLLEHVSTGKRGEGPAWSPDGRHVAVVVNGELQVIPLEPDGTPAGPALAFGTGAADQLSWSADSRRVLFSENDRVMVASLDGMPPREWALDFTYVRHVPSGTYVIHAGRLVDGVADDAQRDVDVVITGHRIARVVPHDPGEHRGEVVDASNFTLMPGLIEAHGHYSAEYGRRFGQLHLAYGITSVRSPAGHPYASLAERETVEAGRRPGPRLFATGYVVDGGRIYYPISSPSADEAAIDRELARARLLEFDLLKTYVRLPDALQRRVIDGAHAIGIPVSSHEVYPAAASGIDGVEHFAATSRRGYSPKVSLLGRSYEDVVRVVAGAGMTVTPTLALGRLQGALDASASWRADPRWRLQPAWVREALAPRPTPAPPSGAALTQRRETLVAYHRAGVPILAGTDSPIVPYGLSLHVELEEYVAAGLTPLEALRAATVNVARALHAGHELGTIEPGKLADLVAVEGDPLSDIRAARNVRLLVVNGVVRTPEEIATPAR